MRTFRPSLAGSLPVVVILVYLAPTAFPQAHRPQPINVRAATISDPDATDFSSLSSSELFEAEDNGIPHRTASNEGGVTMAFVFDVTGSMFNDLQQVIAGAERILDSNLKRYNEMRLKNFALVPFHDPEIQEITLTEDPDYFQLKLKELYVQGGGDCPEKSITAIYHALNISEPRSYIYVFTDARSNDYHLTNEVLKLIQEKESQVVFVMTGDCANQSHPGFQAYEQIAATSSGQVFMLNKSDVDLVLRFVEVSLQSRKVNLISTDYTNGATQIHMLPIDSTIRQLTISISGDSRNVILRDPNGRDVPLERTMRPGSRQYMEELLTLENVYVLGMAEPVPGTYQLITNSDDEHTLRVTAVSLLDFAFGFSREPTSDLNATYHRPVKGVEANLLIEAIHLNPPGVLEKIEFLNLRGERMYEARLTRSPTNPDVYLAPNTIPPDEYFHIRVTGIDSENFRFQRITKTAISPLVPDPPVTFMPRRTPGHFGHRAVLTCEVQSLIPFTVQWMKRGSPLSGPMQFSDSASATWIIENADSRVEGVYSCIAENEEGSRRSETYLDITEPPPVIARPMNVSVLPGGIAVLSCQINSTVEFNITWDKPNTLMALQGHSRVSLAANGSLVIRDVQPGDAGAYRCKAQNEGGATQQFVQVSVQERPRIKAYQTNMTFMAGQNVTLRCSADGFPRPEIRWLQNGQELAIQPGVNRGEWAHYIINASHSNEGSYSCVAINAAGSDILNVYVSYQEPPRISMERYRYLAPPSQTITLSCPTSGVPPPEIMWFKGQRDMGRVSYASIHPNGDLDIMGVQEYDAGLYTCTAANEAGTISESVTLVVGSSPVILQPPPLELGVDFGTNVSLSCHAVGHPLPRITWRKVGTQNLALNPRMKMTDDGNLIIIGLQVDDRGTYVCVAQNEHGTAEGSAQLRITNLIQPQIGPSGFEAVVILDEDVVVRCNVLAGNPPPVVTWFHEGERLYPEFSPRLRLLSDGSLGIYTSVLSDAGNYTCMAVNVVGNATKSTVLRVHERPSISTTETSYTAVRHESVTLHCPAEGHPPPMIEWIKNGQTIPNLGLHQSALALNYVTPEDAGTYICRVTNIAGSTEIEITLFVLVPPVHQGVEPLGSVNVTQGETITLPCDFRGNPPPTITWYKDGQVLPLAGRNFYINLDGGLVIQQMSLADEAQYSCVASNMAGNVTREVQLTILVPPSIEPGRTEYTVVGGESVVLSCEAYGIPLPQVRWQKDGELVAHGNGNDNLQVLGEGSLRIEVTGEQHTGTYTCVVTNDAGLVNRTISLEVHVLPLILDWQTQYTVVEGRAITLHCPATGVPPPSITWSKEGQDIPLNDAHYDVDDTAGTLSIYGVLPTDFGTYECLVTNSAGTVTKDITLSVYVRPRLPSDVQETLQVTVGGSLSLPCEVEGTPPPVISWFKAGNQLTVTNSMVILPDSLELYRARPMDSGVYQCVASNVAGNVTKSFRVVVMIPPSIQQGPAARSTEVGGQVELECRADGIPLPEIVWYKDGEPLDMFSDPRFRQSAFGTLQILNVEQEDSGEYACYVSNDAGKASKFVTLTVNLGPRLLDSPDSYTALVRNPVTLQCLVVGYPPPQVSWLKNGAPLNQRDVRYYVTPEHSLLIASTMQEDMGIYTCNASNIAGYQQKHIELIVYVPPTSLTDGDTTYDVTLNNLVSLPCEVYSYPPPTITWLKDGQYIPDTHPHYRIMPTSLDIPRAVVRDSGVYTCIASNIVGNISRSYNIHVQVPPHISPGPDVIIANLTQNVSLPCDSIGVPTPMTMWDKGGRHIDYPAQPRFRLLEEGSLLIVNVQELDAGSYFCMVFNHAGTDSRRITLHVNDPPRITSQPPSVLEPMMNTEVQISCRATGIPRPEVRWFKGGEPIESLQGYTVLADNTLLISSVQPYDNGFYECHAISESGSDSIEVFIDTQVRPHIAGENTPGDPVVVAIEEGHSITLECNVTDSHPPATVTWYRNGQQVQTDIGVHHQTGDTSLMVVALRPEDAGRYYCIATNPQGSSERHFSLEVNVAPVIRNRLQETVTVQVSQEVTLMCDAIGVPAVRVTWQFGDIAISSQNSRYQVSPDGSLRIGDVQVIDTGTFTCIAKNSAGEDYRRVELNVIVPPSINEGPTDMVRTLHSSVILPCEAAGVPFPEITWYKDGGPLNVSADPALEQLVSGSLRIQRVAEDHSGRYRCVAVNQAGHDHRMLSLWIHTPPSLEPDLPRNVSTGLDQDIILPCGITASPTPQYRWLKNNRELRLDRGGRYQLLPNGALMVRGVESLDRGTYTCEATNSVGVLNNHIRVDVSVAPKIPAPPTNDYQVEEYDSIAIQCRVTDAYPPPVITWYRGNQLLTGQEPAISILDGGVTLEIGSVEEALQGEYYCIASNEAGEDSRRWNIVVQVAPRILNGQEEFLSTTQNLNITLPCVAEGNPPPVVWWERDGKTLRTDGGHYTLKDDGSLFISSPQHTDSGRYVCMAQNFMGDAEKHVHLEVKIPPQVTTEKSQVIIGLGQSVTLSCRAVGYPAPTITWQRDGRPIPLSSRAFRFSSNRGSLIINSTRETDGGVYTCIGSNDVGLQARDILLKIQERPSITRPLTDAIQRVQPIEGDDISLPCVHTGFPKPEIVWFKGNQLLSPPDYYVDEDGTLVTNGVSPQDSGEYTCLAINDAGNTSMAIHVSVLVRPSIVDASVPVDLEVVLNNPVSLQCIVEGAVPPPEITWLKDGSPVRPDSNVALLDGGQTLAIRQVQVSDRGRYTCRASNPAGNDTKFFGLTVNVPPMFPDGVFLEPTVLVIDEDDSTSLSCHPSGYPHPVIEWYKDGRLVTHNEPGVSVSADGEELIIERVNRIHDGEFTCVARNSVGNVTKGYVVNVRVSPEIEGAEYPHNVSVITSQGIELTCPTLAIPIPTIRWYKDGRPLHPYYQAGGLQISPDGTTLRIPDAQLHDEGVYQCVATNEAGEQMKQFNLQIDVPPVIISRAPSQVAVIAGGSATLDCESYGVPKPTISWTKNNAFISPASARYQMDPSGVLTIASVTMADEGVFECFVSNSAGNTTRRLDLQVQVRPSINPGPSRVTARVGQSVRIDCDASGEPAPQILWQKDGRRVQATDGFVVISDGMLMIHNAQPSDAGRYVCIAKNGAGADVLKVTLEVHEPPSIANPLLSYEVRIESSVELECRVEGIPQPTIQWRYKGRDLPPFGVQYLHLANGNLKIPVVRAEDGGEYTCVAQNDAGFSQAQRFLVVLDVPRLPSLSPEQAQMTISVNRQAILTCPAEGYPPPEVRWRKDGVPIQPFGRITMTENHELIIDRVQESDSGTYTCIATNMVGSNEISFYLTVQVAPSFTRFPNDIELPAGNRLEMVCQAIGVPMPTITWLVNGTEIIPNPRTLNGRSMLAINNIQKSDSGSYMCQAENLLGIRTAITAVRVRVPPRILPTLTGTTLTLGQRAVLHCAVEGDPKPEITWLKDNMPVAATDNLQQSSNGSLIIARTSISDGGYYECQAVNLYGQAEVGYHLEIQSVPSFSVEPTDVTVSHGDSILIDCVARGEPQPSVRWEKGSFRVFPGGRVSILPNNTLRIVAAQLTDSAEYRCIAENRMGRRFISIRLTVMVHGRWGEWQPWEECSVTCGYGVRARRRACDNPPPQYGGRECEGLALQQDECFGGECPVDGGWGPWSLWQLCDRTCGTGNTIRERLCNNPEPRHNGRDCRGLSRETRTCNLSPCPVDGFWGQWTLWSTCTVSCGVGQKTRSRTCNQPLHGGLGCEGQSEQTMRCNTEACPVHGHWSDWGRWSTCSAMCNGGTRQRFRSCTKPAPSPTGRPCVGDSIDTQSCNQQPCRVDGRWSPWSDWSECSATCGDSQQAKRRACDSPAPAHGGRVCSGTAELIRSCEVPRCIVGPRQAIAHVTANINGETLLRILHANISVDNAGYTWVTANMQDVPENIGSVMRMLISLISPVYWTSAYERENTANGFTVTQGEFERQTEVQFWSGENVTMGMRSQGVDENGVLHLTILLSGETPEVYPEDQILTRDYSESYIQTGPGEIYGKSSRHVNIEGTDLLYAWNHTITYNDAGQRMAYLVQSLHTEGATVEYNAADGSLTYTIRVYFTRGEPRNQCPTGFRLDMPGPYCRDVNECLNVDTCSHSCQNFYGGFVCTCPPGFTVFNGRICEDINECRYRNGGCQSHQECQNTAGSFKCVSLCSRGTRRRPGTAECDDINECQETPNICSHQCFNTMGSYRCTCRQGYRLRGQSHCQDVDECAELNPCHINQECRNRKGDYTCVTVCRPGYERARNGSCVDIDECQTNQHQCSSSQRCHNSVGSFACLCPRGYRAEGRLCFDDNECFHENTCTYQCKNTMGDYECLCRPGMQRMPDKKTCIGRPQQPHTGANQLPTCPTGFQLRGERCVDIDECSVAELSLCNYRCENTEGSFQCHCPPGYRLNPDQKSCDDINECIEQRVSCGQNELCFNRKGNYSCLETQCPQYYIHDFTGHCKRSCPRSLSQNAYRQCMALPQSIRYMTLALFNDTQAGWDLLRLKLVKPDNTNHNNTYFSIQNSEVPFRIRTNDDGIGILSARRTLHETRDYVIQVRAQGFSGTRFRSRIELDRVYHIYVAVSRFPYHYT